MILICELAEKGQAWVFLLKDACIPHRIAKPAVNRRGFVFLKDCWMEIAVFKFLLKWKLSKDLMSLFPCRQFL